MTFAYVIYERPQSHACRCCTLHCSNNIAHLCFSIVLAYFSPYSSPHNLQGHIMPMRRAGSVQSTLSTMQRRATRYQKYLTLASVILIITSTIVIFSSVLLIRFYHLPTLAFWSSYFQIAPILMISPGAFKFIAACYGFGITGTENRGTVWKLQNSPIYNEWQTRSANVLALPQKQACQDHPNSPQQHPTTYKYVTFKSAPLFCGWAHPSLSLSTVKGTLTWKWIWGVIGIVLPCLFSCSAKMF